MSKLRAVEVISDKLWITYDTHNNKSGTLSKSESSYSWLKVDGDKVKLTSSEVVLTFDLEVKSAESSWHAHHVFGYPVPKIETFKIEEQNNLPCFTKTISSTVFFAAGYYGINFDNGGWMESFCPKANTLKKYEYLGPFKTESDMQIAVKRKKRTHD